jgi:hypothetical protein
MKKRNSIVTDDWEHCFICQSQRNLQEHHCFGAGNRKLSTKYGLTIPLCIDCHTGNKGVHNNYQLKLYVMRVAQKKFEDKYGHEEFMKVIGRNYD